MSLTSAMNTALTGMSAAETMIDVDGNNIANSNTVGYKASTATFASQFLQTQGLGSTPTTTNGGTNPRQIGMGTMVAEISPNFTQGTVEISSNATDMAIQGNGFFIVQGQNGVQEYSRNGVFKLNSNNELVNATGNRLLGYAADKNYQIQTTQLVPITIPLGAQAVAKATQNVQLQGALAPNGVPATAAQVIQSGVLGDASISSPTWTTLNPPTTAISLQQPLGAATAQPSTTGSSLAPGTYYYKVTYSDADPPTADPDGNPIEGTPSSAVSATTDVANDAVSIPTNALTYPTGYKYVNIYRSTTGNANDYQLLDTVSEATAQAGPYIDDGSKTITTQALNNQTLDGTYTYYIAYENANGTISRPSQAILATNANNGRVHITNFPTPDPNDPMQWTNYVIYRNYNGGETQFVKLDTVPITNAADPTYVPTFTDSVSDDTLKQRAIADPTSLIDFNGPPAKPTTRLVDLLSYQNGVYQQLFDSSGTLEFTGQKGGNNLATKDLTVIGSNPPAATDTTVSDLLTFMTESMGIQSGNGIPPSADTKNPGGILQPGATILADGQIQIVGNNGTSNAVGIDLSGLQFVNGEGQNTVNMPFGTYQTAVGESTSADLVVYDSLGIGCNVRVTMDLESESNNGGTVYRWFADSPDNQLASGNPSIAVGTGTIKFDGQGNFVSDTNDTVTVNRENVASVSPLIFKLDFSDISGVAATASSVQEKSQDGSPPGTLSSFILGEDGVVTGVFTNGIQRTLGQIRLANFSNPAGLEQKGQNLYATGINSGLPIIGNPGQQGIGSIVAGAVELSNTDIGGSLTDLILASTMYRGNAQVITTTQTLFDNLLALKRD